MIKIELYTGNKTYMFPNGNVATPDIMESQYPAIKVFPHVIETDEVGQVCWAIENLSAMKSRMGISQDIPQDEAIRLIEEIRNKPDPEPEPDLEERKTAAVEAQTLLMM